MRKIIFLLLLIAMAGETFSQALPEGMTNLLPSGVKTNIETTQQGTRKKDLTVAGEKSKGYQAFFAASNEANGEELWVTDGTAAGTRMVKDIYPGPSGSDVNYLTRFNDKVVFGADDGQAGMELWISDGTEAGTRMIKDIHDFSSSNPRGFTQLNETQFIFIAQNFDSENYDARGAQWWLYVSDGTAEGTELIYECDTKFPGAYATTWTTSFCRVGRKVFFKADKLDGGIGEELWVTDGTREGTKLVMDINTEPLNEGTAGSAPTQFVNFYNEKLFFKAWTVEYGAEPWASDGTPEGTYLIKDTNPAVNAEGKGVGGEVSTPGINPYNGKIYYRGYSPETGVELACTNLEKDDYTIFDINENDPTNTNNSTPDPGVEFDGVYMFCATSGGTAGKAGNFGGEQWYTDGTTVTMQSDKAPEHLSHWVKNPVVASGSLYWWNAGAAVPDDKEKLFRIDNKSEVPARVTNFNPDGDKIHSIRNIGGDIVFVTNDESKALYHYHYRKPGFNPETETDNLDPEFRTRKEITGIINAPARKTVLVYPNPATDQFSFDVPGTLLSVKVFDITGRFVKNETGLTINSVDISSLSKGIYGVLITTSEGSFTSSLIIK